MRNGRQARSAKQARRDARRAKKRNGDNAPDTTLKGLIRNALANRHPLRLLGLASLVIHRARPETASWSKADRDDRPLDAFLTGLIGARNRETTALLSVIAELLVDDPRSRLRCRQELATRDDHLPRWITALSQVDPYRAVRRSDVLGDVDEVVIGMRLTGEHQLSLAVLIDHNTFSGIADADVVPAPIDVTLARVAESSSDIDVVEMTLADARVWIEDAFDKPTLATETDSWPLCRALVRWLVAQLPEGGEHRSSPWDWESTEQLCDRFFASSSAAPFTRFSHRELLLELLETGSGDPVRWSAGRVELAIGRPFYHDGHIPLEVVLDAPDLLRAFIPFAHGHSGIRDELTSRALAVIDALRSGYKREVLRQATCWEFDDAG